MGSVPEIDYPRDLLHSYPERDHHDVWEMTPLDKAESTMECSRSLGRPWLGLNYDVELLRHIDKTHSENLESTTEYKDRASPQAILRQ